VPPLRELIYLYLFFKTKVKTKKLFIFEKYRKVKKKRKLVFYGKICGRHKIAM
jgi:hypothetical protein